MANRLGGAFEIIGLRAVMLDVRQYIADGKSIERANDSLLRSNKRLADQKVQLATLDKKLLPAAQLNLAQAQARLAQAQQARAQAQQAPLQRIPSGQQGAGQFIARNVPGIAAEEKAVLDAERNIASLQRQRISLNTGIATGTSRIKELEEQTLRISRERLRLAAGLGAAIAGLVVVAGIGAAISSASKYQNALTKINILTNATDEETKQLGDRLLELSKTVPSSPAELGEAAYQVLSSGIQDVNKALEITRLSAIGAAVGLGTAKDVAGVLTTVLNTYGQNNITAAQASDILIAAVKEGRGEAQDFGGALGRILPVAAALGIEFDQVAASMAVLTNGGLSAEEAATGLRAILQDLAKGTPEAEKALKAIGTTSAELRTEIKNKGLPETVQNLIQKFQGNLQAIEPIIPNIRGLVAAYSAFVSQGGQVTKVLDNIDNASGVTSDALEKQSKTFSFQAGILRNEFSIALIKIGTAILPAVTSGLSDFINLIDKNQSAIQNYTQTGLKTLIKVLEDVVRGTALVASGIGAVTSAISAVVGPTNTASLSIAALGLAFAAAIPGPPQLKLLAAAVILLGEFSRQTGPKGSIAQELAQRGQKEVQIGPLKSGGLLNKLLLGSSEGLTDAQLKEAKAAAEAQKSTDPLADALKKADEITAKFGQITLPQLSSNVGNLGNAAALLIQKLEEAEKAFAKTSEASGQVEDFTSKLKDSFGSKLFGDIPFQTGRDLGLSAIQAGNVQGLDAVGRAQERATAKAYQFTAALAAVAEAFQKSAATGQQIVLSLAQSALEASRTAAQNLFSRPTREVADLNVGLARQHINTILAEQAARPQLRAADLQSRAIERQLRELQKSQSAYQKEKSLKDKVAQQQRDQANKIAQAASDAAQRAADAQLDALRFANLQAEINAERIQAKLQDLIDANTKQISDLQEGFLKSNEALQTRINRAIGKGDTQGALALVKQQQDAAKAYQSQVKGLNDSNEALTFQQKQLQKQEEERQRSARLAEAALEMQTKQTKAMIDNTKALDEQTKTIDDTIDPYQAQIDALTESQQSLSDFKDNVNDSVQVVSDQEQAIKDQIDLYQANTDVLKAQVEAADRTLLTQAEQMTAAQELINQINIESSAVRDLSGRLNQSLIPGMDEARAQFDLLQKSLEIINNPNKLIQFIDTTFNAGAKLTQILDDAAGVVKATVDNFKVSPPDSKQLQKEISDAMTLAEQVLVDSFDKTVPPAIAKSGADTLGQAIFIQTPKAFGPLQSGIGTFINVGVDPATGRLVALGNAAHNAAGSFSEIKGAFSSVSQIIKNIASQVSGSFSSAKKNAYGGIYSTPTNIQVGDEYRAEAVIPLAHPQRARQIISQIPPSMMAGLFATYTSRSPMPSINVSVQGETLDAMEVTAIRAVQRAFRDARNTSQRSGALIGSGLGPSR